MKSIFSLVLADSSPSDKISLAGRGSRGVKSKKYGPDWSTGPSMDDEQQRIPAKWPASDTVQCTNAVVRARWRVGEWIGRLDSG